MSSFLFSWATPFGTRLWVLGYAWDPGGAMWLQQASNGAVLLFAFFILDAPAILHLLVKVLKPHVFSSSTTCIRKASPVAAQLSTLATVRAPVWWWTPCFG